MVVGVWRYILEAIQSLDKVLADIERAGETISGLKSAFICEGLRIVTFVCDADGRHPETEKARRVFRLGAFGIVPVDLYCGIHINAVSMALGERLIGFPRMSCLLQRAPSISRCRRSVSR